MEQAFNIKHIAKICNKFLLDNLKNSTKLFFVFDAIYINEEDKNEK